MVYEKWANIVNMSLGTTTYTQSLEAAVNNAYDGGLLLVAAGGNNGPNGGPVYPAAYEKVMAIGATDSGDKLASFSNTSSGIDLVAPGVSINSTYIGSSYRTFSGTSMASPHVAGVAALVWGMSGGNNADVWTRLVVTAVSLGLVANQQVRGLWMLFPPSTQNKGKKAS